MRKLQIISSLFELALPYFRNVTYSHKYDFQPSIVHWTIEAAAAFDANFVRSISHLQRFPKPLELVLKAKKD